MCKFYFWKHFYALLLSRQLCGAREKCDEFTASEGKIPPMNESGGRKWHGMHGNHAVKALKNFFL
jgi:hypothetical protein